jgi:hypothetical protein
MDQEDVSFMQKILDNHFLLVFIGVAVPTLLYTIWGLVDILSIPVAK